jgi:hypothetical protein
MLMIAVAPLNTPPYRSDIILTAISRPAPFLCPVSPHGKFDFIISEYFGVSHILPSNVHVREARNAGSDRYLDIQILIALASSSYFLIPDWVQE